MAKINNIVVHCSDSSFGCRKVIQEWHLQRGWSDIGYHIVILNGYMTSKNYHDFLDGSIEVGRIWNGDRYLSKSEYGAHALGYNSKSLGVCMIGKNEFTDKQFRALDKVITSLMENYEIPLVNVLGHYETPKSYGKTCPNFDMIEYRNRLM